MNVLSPVLIPQLRDLWPWIEKGLATVAERFKPDWEPEDVRAALLTGNAVLHTIAKDQGFIVCQRQTVKGRPILFVWIIYAPGKLDSLRDTTLAELNELAKTIGASRIRMTGRKGWEREGFTPKEIIFEREVW